MASSLSCCFDAKKKHKNYSTACHLWTRALRRQRNNNRRGENERRPRRFGDPPEPLPGRFGDPPETTHVPSPILFFTLPEGTSRSSQQEIQRQEFLSNLLICKVCTNGFHRKELLFFLFFKTTNETNTLLNVP